MLQTAKVTTWIPAPSLQKPAKPVPDVIRHGPHSRRTPTRPHPSPAGPASEVITANSVVASVTAPSTSAYHNNVPFHAHALAPPPSAALPSTSAEWSHIATDDDHQPEVLPGAGTPPSPSANTEYTPSVMTASTLPPSYRTRRSELDFADYPPLPRYSAAGVSGPPSSFQTQTSDRQRASKPQGPRASGARSGARALHIRNASAGLEKPGVESGPAENTKSGAEAGRE